MDGLILEESLHRHRLRQIVDLGDDAPGWVYARWCLDQAYRWVLLNEDPRTDDMVRVVLAATHLDHVDLLRDDPEALQEYGTLVAATDWLAEQLCVYTAGGLSGFLEDRAGPGLLARADLVAEWPDAPLGIYRLREMRDSVLVLHDLVHDSIVEVLNVGAFAEQPTDVVLGRVVPISTPPGLMFDSRPVPLDEQTASEAAIAMRGPDPLGWLDALTTGREEGRLERGFSCQGQTLFSSDIVPERSAPARQEKPGRLLGLLEEGLGENVANGIMVAEVALIAAVVSAGSICALGPHLTAVLTDSQVFAAALDHCTAPEHETAWRRLASVTSPPVRERCLELAAQCRRAA